MALNSGGTVSTITATECGLVGTSQEIWNSNPTQDMAWTLLSSTRKVNPIGMHSTIGVTTCPRLGRTHTQRLAITALTTLLLTLWTNPNGDLIY